MIGRSLLTAIMLTVWGAVEWGLHSTSTLQLSEIANRQFENSNEGYLVSSGMFKAFSIADMTITFIGIMMLIALWWHPAKKAIAAVVATLTSLSLLLVPFGSAKAYYDQTDYAEVYFILPNESAFFVPDVGANKDTQAKFGSEDYYNSNKIAAKRFQIPHTKLAGSSYWSNFYVPTGRLIIVDRTPYSREWTAATNRGSSTKNESFPCQSKEGMDITLGITIGASVLEENAAKFLYRFGVRSPTGERNKPEVIFTSVYYGRSLTEVMDGPVRNEIQSLVCSEFTSRTLDEGNAQAKAIMSDIEKNTTAYLANQGITLDYIGWADTFTFDKGVQDAINRKYIADKDAAIAAELAPHVNTLEAVALAEATRTTAGKWNGVVPSSVSLWWLPSALTDWFTGIFNKK